MPQVVQYDWLVAREDSCVREYLAYASVEKGLSKNSISAYRRDLARLSKFLAELGVEVSDASNSDLREFLAELFNSGMSARSVARWADRRGCRRRTSACVWRWGSSPTS